MTKLHSYDYSKQGESMAIFVLEEYIMFSGFYQTNYYVLSFEKNEVHIDVVGGAAGKGTMMISLGWHKRFIKKFRTKLEEFCEANSIYYEEFETSKYYGG